MVDLWKGSRWVVAGLALAAFVVLSACGESSGDSQIRSVVEGHARQYASQGSFGNARNVKVRDLSISVDGATAVATGVLYAEGGATSKGPFDPMHKDGTEYPFRAKLRKFDTGWRVESFDRTY